MLRCKKNIPFIIIAIIIAVLAAFYVVAYIDSALSRTAFESYNFKYIFTYVISKKVTLKLYGYCILIVALAFVCLFISDTKSYQSEVMQITDTIATPVSAGQGQCGTAKWLTKDKFDKAFSSYELDISQMNNWLERNLKDIEEELLRIDKMSSDEVEKELEQIDLGKEDYE